MSSARCLEASAHDDVSAVEYYCVTEAAKLAAFKAAVELRSLRVSSHLSEFLNATQPQDFPLPIRVCNKWWCHWTEHGKLCKGPSRDKSDLGQLCCCHHRLWERWDARSQDPDPHHTVLYDNITGNASLLVAAAADGKQALLQNLWTDQGLQADWHAALAAAVSHKRIDAVHFLLDRGCVQHSCLEPSYAGVPLVIWAASLGQADILESLVEKKASLQVSPTRPHYAYTVLCAALVFSDGFEGAPSVIKYAVKRPADFGWLVRQNLDGKSPMILAAENTNNASLEILLKAGVSPEQTAVWGEMAIHKAAYINHLDTVKMLWKFRANVEAQSARGSTALAVAADRGFDDIVGYLVHVCKANICTSDLWGHSSAHLAAFNGNLKVMEILEHAQGAFANCINQPDDHGLNGLDIAAQQGHVDLVQRLLPKIKDKTTALFWAAEGHPKIVELLLQAVPASLTAKQPDGRTALHHAAEAGDVASLRALLRSKADLGSLDVNGSSPLCAAARSAEPRAVDTLLSARAWVGSADWTCLDDAAVAAKWWDPSKWVMAKKCTLLLAGRASQRGAKSLAAILHGEGTENPKATLSIGKLGWTSLHWAVMLRHVVLIQRIASTNPGVGASLDFRGRTALSLASELGLLEAVDLLANPELNSVDETGLSPLMWAAKRGHAGICKKLLQLKADPDQRDASRNTLMHLAALSGKRKVVDVFKKTLDTKSKVQNQLGETALFSAVRSKNASLVKYMLSELNYSANHSNILGRTALFDSLRSCQPQVWKILKEEANIHQRDYLDFGIDELPEFKSSVCLKRTDTDLLWTLDAQVASTSFREKLVDVARDEDFHKYLLVTLALSAILGGMFRCWSHWRGRAALANDGVCVDSDTSDSEAADEPTETESSQARVFIRGGSSNITCCQRVLDVSGRATRIQTAAKEFEKLGVPKQRAFFARCLDVVALLVFPSIMSRVLAWWHMVIWVLLTCVLPPLWYQWDLRRLTSLLTHPGRFLGVRDLWAWLRTAYLLMQLLWCFLMSSDAWMKQHEYLWDLGCYPMSELNQISRDEFPIPFPPLLQAGWPVFVLVCAVGALCVGSLWLLRRAWPSDALTGLLFSIAAVFGLLLVLFWPEVPATLPVSLAGILVTYRAAVLLLTLLWIMVNLPPLAQSSVQCDVQVQGGPEDQVPLSKVAERVYRVAIERRDLAGYCSPEDDDFFQRHCQPETCFTAFKATMLWILDVFLDLQTVVIFAAGGSYIAASLILGAFLWALFASASAGALSKVGSALRQTVRTQVRAQEYQQVLDHEASIEVPISLITTTFSLPFVAHRPASAIMTLASIFMSLVRQASWLYEEFDVCEDMHTYMTERTPKSASSIPKFFPED
ncbi:unnamed protein product [Symbiodinium sp. CCMP2592]|nr:unnamed protein product [Symbiodinium sp. CCMP2592]